jgi:hypothetical protein
MEYIPVIVFFGMIYIISPLAAVAYVVLMASKVGVAEPLDYFVPAFVFLIMSALARLLRKGEGE